jgi:hypothetical protein
MLSSPRHRSEPTASAAEDPVLSQHLLQLGDGDLPGRIAFMREFNDTAAMAEAFDR